MQRAHNIRLNPTPEHEAYFRCLWTWYKTCCSRQSRLKQELECRQRVWMYTFVDKKGSSRQ